ncbi:MAG: hypothetical protein AAF998_26975 [Bacteroidota bacterium]
MSRFLRLGFREALILFGGALMVIAPALYSGFPLLYQDTGAYLATGYEGQIPLGRPVSYGWFIWGLAWGDSLWGAVLAQGLLLSYLIRRTLRVAVPGADNLRFFFLNLAVLTLFSGLGWYAGQLMPDIFAPALLLVIFLIVFDENAHWGHRLGWTVLVWGLAFTHYSHVTMGLALVFLLALGFTVELRRKKTGRTRLYRLGWVTGGIFAAVFSLFLVNQQNGFGWRMTRASHVFLTGRVVANGMLGAYLKETCPDRDWRLCPYKDNLPYSATNFIWNDNSPFKQTGYWFDSQEEYSAMLADMIRRPKYLAWFALEGLEAGLQQVLHIRVGEGVAPYGANSSPWKFFERQMPEKLPLYQASRQAQGLDFTWINAAQFLLFGGSVLALFFAFGPWKSHLNPEFFQLFAVLIMGYLLNAFLTAALGNTYDRLQARMVWQVILLGMLVVRQVYLVRKPKDDF